MKHDFMTTVLIAAICAWFLTCSVGCESTTGGVRWGEESTQPPPVPEKGPPAHAPAHGYRAKYRYYYYPDVSVYLDIDRRVYFYLEENEWMVTVSLPDRLRVRLGDYVTLELDTDKPYKQHNEHKKKYPPGQLKKKKH